MSLDQLKAELAAKMVERRAEVAEMIAVAKVNVEISKLESPLFVKREMLKTDLAKLTVIEEQIQEAYDRDDRKMSLVFGLGVVPNRLLAVLKSIQYSKKDEKDELLMMIGSDEQMVEDVLDAFGNSAYFSKAAIEVVPEIQMDIPRVKELLQVVALDLGLVSKLDLCKFNDANIKYMYDRAQVRAEEMYFNTKEFVETAVAYKE